MTFNGWLQIAIYSILVILITKPFGLFAASRYKRAIMSK